MLATNFRLKLSFKNSMSKDTKHIIIITQDDQIALVPAFVYTILFFLLLICPNAMIERPIKQNIIDKKLSEVPNTEIMNLPYSLL